MPRNFRLEDLRAAVDAAGRFDPTIRVDDRGFGRMLRRHVHPMPYARDALFGRMLSAEPSLFTGFPRPLQAGLCDRPLAEAGTALVEWLASRRSRRHHRIYTGPTGVRRLLTLHGIALKWRADRTPFGVTDLHIRRTEMEDVVAPDVLSRFNLLPAAGRGPSAQEMFSFVISSTGCLTDSHSDDPDSSNFCILGRKLWLAWDTYEGMKRGLWDVERLPISGQARFEMAAWLSLKSARWWLVEPGQTLFLPATMTHKVVTLERYIGVGGFFVALPNSLRLLAHWIARGPLWSKRDSTGERDDLLSEIAESVRRAIVELRGAPLAKRREWGYDYLPRAAAAFIAACPPARLRLLGSDTRFRRVADVISAPWPWRGGRDVDA